MTLAQVQALLHAAVTVLAGERVVIWERQNGPRPSAPYVGLFSPRLVPETDPDSAVDSDGEDGYEAARRTQHGLYLDVACYGGAAVDAAWAMQRGFWSEAVREALGAITLVDVDAIQDLTGLKDQRFEPRAQFTVRLRAAVEDREVLPIIESVNLERGTSLPG